MGYWGLTQLALQSRPLPKTWNLYRLSQYLPSSVINNIACIQTVYIYTYISHIIRVYIYIYLLTYQSLYINIKPISHLAAGAHFFRLVATARHGGGALFGLWRAGGSA